MRGPTRLSVEAFFSSTLPSSILCNKSPPFHRWSVRLHRPTSFLILATIASSPPQTLLRGNLSTRVSFLPHIVREPHALFLPRPSSYLSLLRTLCPSRLSLFLYDSLFLSGQMTIRPGTVRLTSARHGLFFVLDHACLSFPRV